ncbi:MAG: hypothetical protein M3N08_00640 [Pseudomonadota bacterium]|nr:hypothetical protein [Pseudomonadota bacterium]
MHDLLYVTGDELKNNLAKYRLEAQSKPVGIWDAGQDTADVVLISAREYRRLNRAPRQVVRVDDMTDEQFNKIASATMSPEHSHLDQAVKTIEEDLDKG